MNDLIEEFENETELPATWNTGNMGGYTKEYTEWLAERAVNKNDLLQRVSNQRRLLIAFADAWNSCDASLIEYDFIDKYLECN